MDGLGKRLSNPKIREKGFELLHKTQKAWTPKLACRWLDIDQLTNNRLILTDLSAPKIINLNLGFSGRFLKGSKKVLIGAYTVGPGLEKMARRAGPKKQIFDSWLYDTVSLAILDMLGKRINKMAEQYALYNGWGVSPVLSPGSVHGWDLLEQKTLCSILPLYSIGIRLMENGVFTPFHSLSFLIGAGPGLKAKEVGQPCRACSRQKNCSLSLANRQGNGPMQNRSVA
jgi:hypothetical protein